MKQKKKNAFFTFIYSFLPGGAEMYMGFMKNGFSLMAIFMLVLALLASTGVGALYALTALVWFFGFFHARHMASLDDDVFYSIEDCYIWEEFIDGSAIPAKTVRTWFAVFIILVGVGAIWNYVTESIYPLIPAAYWDQVYPIIKGIPGLVASIAMIVIGVMLLKGKKKELEISGYIGTTEEN